MKTEGLYPVFQDIKAVHFDLDGSLVDSAGAWFESEIELLRGYGVELSVEQIRDITHDDLVGRGQKFAARFYKEKFDISAPVEEIRAKRIELVKKYYGDVELMEGAEEFLKTLARSPLKVTLATSSPLDLTDIFISKYGYEEFFDGVVSGEQVEQSKPSPRIFLKAAETVGVRPEDSLVIEDSKAGLLAARKAGSLCLLIPNKKFSHDGSGVLERSDFIVQTMSEIDLEEVRKYLPREEV